MERPFSIKFRLSFYDDNDGKKFSDDYNIVTKHGAYVCLVEKNEFNFIKNEIYQIESDQPFAVVLTRTGKKVPEMVAFVVDGSPNKPSLLRI